MITTDLLDINGTRRVVNSVGAFSVVEYEKDISVSSQNAEQAYFESAMSYRKRQLVADICEEKGVIAQRGTLQMLLGRVEPKTGIENVGDLMKKYVGSKVTGESAIKPHYKGTGTLVLEPTYKYILLEDLDQWNNKVAVEDGMFLACEDSIELKVSARTNLSSAALGGEGLFNLTFEGKGVIALESPVPREELVAINLVDDIVKIDGRMAIAWSKDLEFTVEKTTPTFVGSIAAGEGLVNVYRGTGKILMAPIRNNPGISRPDKNAKRG